MTIDQSLFEKVILLALTALISGFGIPYMLKRVEERRAREQKVFEAQLARQGKVIEAQSKLLDDIAQVLWQWRYLAKKVVYYAAHENRAAYGPALAQYDENVWDVLNALRVQISASRRLVSDAAHARLLALYHYIVDDIDRSITTLVRSETLDVQASQQIAQRFSDEVSTRLDKELDRLAAELKLKVTGGGS